MVEGGAAGLRAAMSAALDAALASVDPAEAVRRACRGAAGAVQLPDGSRLDVDRFGGGTVVIGAGKAATGMARGLLSVLEGHVVGGTIATKHGHAGALPLDVWEAGHPEPDVGSLAAAADALAWARRTRPDQLIVCLLSGGASSVWAAPVPGVTLGDLRDLTRALLRSGAPIEDLNCVRKHLSTIAGGRLAATSSAGRLVTLAISDVLGDPPDVVGSGPTVPDPTTHADALDVLRRWNVQPPPSVADHLRRGAEGAAPETIDASHPVWARTAYHVIARLDDAIDAAAARLSGLGFEVEIVSRTLAGEARIAGAEIARSALEVADGAPGRRVALLWGGETTVTVRGNGRGGRNQEMALAAALGIEGRRDVLIGCVATDGTDGPTDAAGGIVDGRTAERARSGGRDPADALSRNDAYDCLDAAGDLLRTGPTGTNVNDIAIALVGTLR